MKSEGQASSAGTEGTSLSQRSMVVVCGSDVVFPENQGRHLLDQLLINLKQSAIQSETRTVCFSPTSYGTAAQIESIKEQTFAHHTLPCPAIPIPRGTDFLGRHVSQVEADVHLPLPDAFRTFQLQQSIRALQRAGEPVLLHAHTPGVIGFHILREARKRRMRGKPIPIVATHWTRYQPFIETRFVEIAKAIRLNHSQTFNEAFAHGGLLEELFPTLHKTPEGRAGIERLIRELRSVVYHWYSKPNEPGFRANRVWGRLLLGLANVGSRHAHHRLQGSLAAANAVGEVAQLLSTIAGVSLVEVWRRPVDSQAIIDGGIRDLAGQLVRGYLASFYVDCDRVLNFEGPAGRDDLRSLGVPSEKVVNLDAHSELCQQLGEVYSAIAGEAARRITPKRILMSDFEWGSEVDPRQPSAAHLALSDVHLGDGSGTERAKATLELRPHIERLGVQRIEIVGDLIQRDVSPDVSSRHRESFLAALQLLTTSVSGAERTVLDLQFKLDPSSNISSKRLMEVRRELHDLAVKVGARIEFEGSFLGIPKEVQAASIPVFIERGNHDEGEELKEVIPGSVVSESMIRPDEVAGVLFCHGNIWNLPEVPAALKQAQSLAELEHSFTEVQLRSSLETAQVIYSMTSAVWRACAKRIDIRTLWKKDLQPALSKLVQWHREGETANESSTSEYSRFLSGIVSPVDNASVAAQCGITVRSFNHFCWAVCDGHSHRPSIEFVDETHPQTGQPSGSLLVNCGKFHGKNITAVILKFPEAVIFEWDDRDQTYYVLRHYRLNDDEIRKVTQSDSRRVPTRSQPSASPRSTKHRARTLLEVCTEGGGHKERQLAFLPLYESQGTVRVAASGDRPLPWAHEHWPGYRLVYDGTGSVRSLSTTFSYMRRKRSIWRKAREISESLENYTHAITDFAPVLPLALQLARKTGRRPLPTLFHISHHAAMHSRYQDTPRPLTLDRLTFWGTQRFLDSISGDVNIGFHFERYHPDIFYPPIAPDFLNIQPSFASKIVLVYLNGSPSYLAEQCHEIDPSGDHEWHIYSSQQSQIEKSRYSHIWQFPLGKSYRDKLPHARASLTLSGFMGPAELIHLGKPMIVMPTPGHGEHAFNAAALQEISDITVVPSISDTESQRSIRRALGEAKDIASPISRIGRMGPVGPYGDVRHEVVRKVFSLD